MERRRSIADLIAKSKDHKHGRIIVFTGARQVGKTTLARHCLEDYVYLSLDDVVTSASYLRLSASQWNDLYPKAILDEVQKVPALVDSIKSVYDQFPAPRYALLGSSQILLLKKISESLAGRCRIFDMFPLTLPELQTRSWDDVMPLSYWQRYLSGEYPELFPDLNIHPRMSVIKQAWQYYLTFGGYPALVDEDLTDEDRYRWLAGYVRTYLERDVRDLARINDLEPYMRLQQLMAAQTGQTIVVSSAASDVGVSSKTVKNYLEYLQLSYQVLSLPAWSRNVSKRFVKASKMHFMDFGVLQAVLNKRGGMTGNEFESFVVTELYKQAKNLDSSASFYHLRVQDGAEIDLLVEIPEGYFAFEIKLTEHVTAADARHLKKIEELLDKPLIHGFVLSNDNRTMQITDKITAISAALFLA